MTGGVDRRTPTEVRRLLGGVVGGYLQEAAGDRERPKLDNALSPISLDATGRALHGVEATSSSDDGTARSLCWTRATSYLQLFTCDPLRAAAARSLARGADDLRAERVPEERRGPARWLDSCESMTRPGEFRVERGHVGSHGSSSPSSLERPEDRELEGGYRFSLSDVEWVTPRATLHHASALWHGAELALTEEKGEKKKKKKKKKKDPRGSISRRGDTDSRRGRVPPIQDRLTIRLTGPDSRMRRDRQSRVTIHDGKIPSTRFVRPLVDDSEALT